MSLAQARTVTGVVTDAATGRPLPLVNIQIKGTTGGTVTDNEGRYSLRVDGPEAVLVFFSMGYESKEVSVAAQSEINVQLGVANEEIDQVVVVGYGTARKTGSTVGNIASVGGQVMESKPIANPLEALGGKVAGMSVLTGSGEPSAQADVTIHGIGSLSAGTEPLYILDGIPVGSGTILAMNPNDFQQVDVLKDASATSIYGSRAANGVIFITTKRGQAGDKGDVQVRFSYGWTSLASYDFFNRRMSSDQLRAFYKDIGRYTDADIEANKKRFGDTDFSWVDYIYSKNVPTHQGDITFSGGKGNTIYYISGNYMMSKGMRPGSLYNKYGMRANINSKPKDWLRVGVNSSIYYDQTQVNAWEQNDPRATCYYLLPWYSPYDADGKEMDLFEYDGADFYSISYNNSKNENETGVASLVASAYLQIEPVKGLTVRSQAGVDAGFLFKDVNGKASHIGRVSSGGTRINTMKRYATANITNTIEYKLVLADNHSLIPLVGHEYVRYGIGSFSARADGLESDYMNELGHAVNKSRTEMKSGGEEYWFNSFFGRLEYNYANRYFFDASVRNDASSRFSKQHRNALFWSAGLMWKAKSESFLQDVAWLDELTPRVSVGTSGNADIGNYAWMPKAGFAGTYGGSTALGLGNPGNPNLTWEQQFQITAGVSLGFLNMVSLDASFYRRYTSSMLMRVPIPYYLGVDESIITSNIGAMSNTGVDLTLEVTPWRSQKGGDYVSCYANYNYNMDRVEKLFGGLDHYIMHNAGVAYVVGKPIQFFYPLFYRIDPETGYSQFYLPDPENPSKTTKDPSRILTVPSGEAPNSLHQASGYDVYPHHMGGFGLSASYFGFYVQADFMYVLGKWMISNDAFFFRNPNKFPTNNYDKDLIDNYWTPNRRNAKYPKKESSTWFGFDDRLISNASFLRMKNLTVGYSVPEEWLKLTRFFTSAKVYCTLRNFLTVTAYNGLDPEPSINLSIGGNPATKQVVVGVDFKF